MSDEVEGGRKRFFPEESCMHCGTIVPVVWSREHGKPIRTLWTGPSKNIDDCIYCAEESKLIQQLRRLSLKDKNKIRNIDKRRFPSEIKSNSYLYKMAREKRSEEVKKIRKRQENRKNRIHNKIRKLRMTKEQYKRFLEEAKREEDIKKHGPILDLTTFPFRRRSIKKE